MFPPIFPSLLLLNIGAFGNSGRRRDWTWRAWLKPGHRCLVPVNSFAE
jgi:hypothetical protein